MEADYQQDKQTHIDRVAVLRVLAVCLEVLEVHGLKIWGEITK